MSRDCSPSPSICDRLALEHPAGEDRHHPSFFCVEVLSGAVDVCVAQHSELETESALEGAEVLLEAVLAGAVRRQRSHGVVFISGDHVGLAIEGAARGDEYHLLHRVIDACFEQVQAADDVDLSVVGRIGHGLRDLRLRCVVVHDVRAK